MNLFGEMAQLSSGGRPFVLATVVQTDGSCPQKAGAKLVVLADGTLHGTIGGGAIELQIVQEARALLADPSLTTRLMVTHLTHDLGMCCGGSMSVFLDKILPGERLLIFGAGHVGRALYELGRAAGFSVTVADARADWLNAERYPQAERLLGDPKESALTTLMDEATYACVLTHDHGLDQDLVEVLLKRPFKYLGMIGSRRKAEKLRARLKHLGVAQAEIDRVRSPMGVDIGAQSPEEIAVSIVAELVSVRHGGPKVPPAAGPS